MDPKLTILFLLIGSIIGLSHLGDENLARMRRQLVTGVGAISCRGGANPRQSRRAFQISVIASVSPPRSTASAAARRLAVFVVEDRGRGSRAGAAAHFTARTSTRIARRVGARLDRQHGDSAERGRERRQHLVQRIGAPDQRQHALRLEQTARRSRSSAAAGRARRMRQPPARVGRDVLPCARRGTAGSSARGRRCRREARRRQAQRRLRHRRRPRSPGRPDG